MGKVVSLADKTEFKTRETVRAENKERAIKALEELITQLRDDPGVDITSFQLCAELVKGDGGYRYFSADGGNPPTPGHWQFLEVLRERNMRQYYEMYFQSAVFMDLDDGAEDEDDEDIDE